MRINLYALAAKVAAVGVLVATMSAGYSLATAELDAAFGATVKPYSTLPACDGGEGESPVRCVWDARHMGNGEGRSFRINRQGQVKYLSHARAHALTFGTERI